MTSNSDAQFLSKFPEYKETIKIDELRQRDYHRLDKANHVYLDYTGSGLYAESQIAKHHKLLSENVFGNPHSTNPTSRASTLWVEETRSAILSFFNADPDEYVVIFTANASGALKLVGESYPFEEGSRYLLTFDNHNSVNGIREYAYAHKAEVTYIPVLPPEMEIDAKKVEQELVHFDPNKPHLFAYPAQSNFSGRRHPLEWIEAAHKNGWAVLLDAAAFAPTNVLD
jgi:selenocysteine lyase/cysteine desulfurase